ncbi:MAG: hypothetical protein LBC41_07215 [Clostridiales bacterium]|jgi:hypothetical protein|nr:hypothetical protein [Clostridiales bacterium]
MESTDEHETKKMVIAYVVLESDRVDADTLTLIREYATNKAPKIPSNATPEEKLKIEKAIKKFEETKAFKWINAGVFIFISTIDVPITEILPLYYTRQEIEQMIDFFKNNCNYFL